ncbi:BA75_05176T0 [Komagataella pastoris]|uniref:BA75_05176T0 n=1 Tax=Komagataella pastoris TaxID=4922 RepID=A0A1B2JIR2_PICPA|nr:BA75_05176T0 [Komagataella pastoris]
MTLSSQASNAIIYVTYGLTLIFCVGLAWYHNDKSKFLSSNQTKTGIPLALNFIASAMGCGILTTYTQVANLAGIHGLMTYTIVGALPIFFFSFWGPLIRKKCPEGFVLTEWTFQRFGSVTGYYLSLATILTMFLFMVAELSAIKFAVEALTGLDGLPVVIVECIVTTIYTSIGGFQVSFSTDNYQACVVLVLAVIGVIGFALNVNIDPELKRETQGYLLGANKLGWQLLYILFIAIATCDCFISGFWLRTFAAKTNKDLMIGTGIASIVAMTICTLVGLPGIFGVWTGDVVIGSPEGYLAFFIMVATMGNWMIGLILIFSIVLSTCTFDSLQSGLTSTIVNDFGRGRMPLWAARVITVLVMVPSIVVAVKVADDVLKIYFIADLISSSVIPSLFIGLSNRFYFWSGWEVVGGGFAGLFFVWVFGTVYYGDAAEGGRLLLIWNGIYDSEDWGPFGAFVVAPGVSLVGGLIICGVRLAVLKVYSNVKGTPFTALDRPEKLGFGGVPVGDSSDIEEVYEDTLNESQSKKSFAYVKEEDNLRA